jgi:hypothetical protein
MMNQEIPIIHPGQNEIRVSFLKEEIKENKDSEENRAVLQEVVTAYNNTVSIKGKTLNELCTEFSAELKKDSNVEIDITRGFLALYSHYGYKEILDNFKGIREEISKNEKFRHCIKSMFCCCLKNYRSTLENKNDFKQFIDDCEYAYLKMQQKKREQSTIGASLQLYINKKGTNNQLPDGI